MRALYIILILLCAAGVSAQKDFQIEVDTPYNRLQVLMGDTVAASATYGLGSWELVDSVKGAFQDYDFLDMETGRAPAVGTDSIVTASSINYVLYDSAKIESYTPNYNNWFAWSQKSIKNTGSSGYLGHRHINFDSLAFPALAEPYGRFGEWIENTSWDNSINAGFEDGGNMIHNFGFNYDLGATNYNALRPNFKWSVEQSYYPGSGSSMWVESHWEMMDTLGRTLRPISIAGAYDGSYAAFSTTSDFTTVFQSPDQIVGDGKWENWTFTTGEHDMWYDYHGRINNVYTGTVLEKYSNTIVAPTYRNILTHDADDDLWVGDSTGIDITNKLRFRINGYSTPLIKSNNYTLQFDTVVVNFLGDNSNVRHFTLQKPGDADRMLFGYDGATMNIGKFNDDEAIIRVHQDAPNYSFGIRSSGKIDFNINGAYGGIDFKQFSDDLAGGWMTRDAAQSYYLGNYLDGSDHWVWNFNGNEYYRFKSNGQINATQYDATPLTGTPFRLLSHETDGDFIAASWIQVIDSTLNNGLMDTILTYGGGTDTDDQNLTIEGSGPTYDIAINDGTDVTIANLYGLTLSESPANTLNFQVDTSKLATQYDISGFGTMSNWLLAASGTGGTETVTNGETVTFAETTGLDATRSTNTVSYALSIDEFTTDGTIEEDELLLAYDPSGTNHELIDVNSLPYLTAEVDGSTTNETNTIEEGNVSVQTGNLNIDFQSMFDVATDGGTEVNVSFDGGEATTVTTAESDDYLLMHDSGLSQNQKMLWSDFVIDIIGFEEDNINEGNGNTFDFGTGLDLSVTGAEADIRLDFNEFATDAATEGDEYVILYDPSAADEEKVLITSLGGADGNGIYDGDGTIPTDTDAAVTDSMEFSGILKMINSNGRVGVGAQSPEARLHVRETAATAEMMLETTSEKVEMQTKSISDGVQSPFTITVMNKDANIDLSGDYYQMGNITFSKASATTGGGAINFNVGYDSTNVDGVLTLKSRESGATDGLVNIVGGLRYKWTSSASASYTLNTGDFGLTMTTTGAKTATLPDAVSGIVGQMFSVFNNAASGDITLTITGGSGDSFFGDVVVSPNESVTVHCPAANKWIINN